MAWITKQETTSKNVLDAELLEGILGGLASNMSEEQLRAYAESLLAPVRNAELEAAQQTYEASKLGLTQEMENLAVQLADAISKQEQSYVKNIAGLETAALQRGMGRSSYLLNTEAALGQALSETIKQLSNENTRQTAQLQDKLTLAAQQNAQTQGRVNTDYATQLAAKIEELRQQQKQEYNQNYLTAVSTAMGSNSVTTNNPEYMSTTPLYVGDANASSSSSSKKTNSTPKKVDSFGYNANNAGATDPTIAI